MFRIKSVFERILKKERMETSNIFFCFATNKLQIITKIYNNNIIKIKNKTEKKEFHFKYIEM
jgi:hypothetical protein